MQQVILNGNVQDKDRRRSPALRLLLGLIIVAGFALAYEAAVPDGTGKAVHTASAGGIVEDENEASQRAVMKWMKENSRMPEHVLEKIYSTAMESVNADLILAICLVESNFNPHVKSGKGAVGLMGIMPGVWLKELKANGIVNSREDLFTISKNIGAGAYVLERYLEKTDNMKEALSRYAGGDRSYATRVLQKVRKITLTRRSQQRLTLASRS
jgi:hypothetical protein